MQKHITVVGALHIGFGVLGIVFGSALFFVLGWAATFVDDPEAIMVLPVLAVFLGGGMAILSIGGIVGGIGVLGYRNWARVLILILSVFDLLNIPIGTAVGVYSIWVLVQDETVRLFNPPPPAPAAS